MAKGEESYNSDDDDRLSVKSETNSEVNFDHFIDFEEQMHEMMIKIQEFEVKLKNKGNLVNSLENKLKSEHELVLQFSLEKALALKSVTSLEESITELENKNERFKASNI